MRCCPLFALFALACLPSAHQAPPETIDAALAPEAPQEPVAEVPPVVTPAPEPEPIPEPEPEPPPWEPLAIEVSPSLDMLSWELLDAPVADTSTPAPGAGLLPERYSHVPGVLSFQGGNLRDGASYGTSAISDKRLELVWSHETRVSTKREPGAKHKNWGGGAGWTGQPAIVQWPAETRGAMNLLPQFAQQDGFVEVVQASLDGHVYFLDLATGQPSRSPTFHSFRSEAFDADTVEVGHPIKGSVSIDPRGWPLLYVGQGIAEGPEFGFRLYSLIDGTRLHYQGGRDPKALRRWGAFDSSALFDRNNDAMLVGGENGLVYRVELNTSFDPAAPSLTIDPQVERLLYTIQGAQDRKRGVENSIAAYKNIAWFADNGGGILAVDTGTMAPIWAWFGEQADDTNATIVVEVQDDHPSLYLGTEIEYQEGVTDQAWVHRFDGLTGEPVWSTGYDCRPSKKGVNLSGGIYGTPVLGQHDVSELLFVSVVEVGELGEGLLVALDKATGQERWRVHLPYYAWSTPVVFYDAEGAGYLVIGDAAGDMILFDAATGTELHRLSLGYLIEAAPAFYEDMIVVAVRGQAIHGIAVR